jgi:hypothetical protein
MTTQPNEEEHGFLFSAEQAEVLRRSLKVIYPPNKVLPPRVIDTILCQSFPGKSLELNKKDFSDLIRKINDKLLWAKKESDEITSVLNRLKRIEESLETVGAFSEIIDVIKDSQEKYKREYLERTSEMPGAKIPPT